MKQNQKEDYMDEQRAPDRTQTIKEMETGSSEPEVQRCLILQE